LVEDFADFLTGGSSFFEGLLFRSLGDGGNEAGENIDEGRGLGPE
jgi:hypothetical protein